MDAGDQHGEDADGERDLAAVQDAGEEVAAQLVGAEQVPVRQRRKQPLRKVLVVGVGQGQDLGQQDGKGHQQGADDADADLHLGGDPAAGGRGLGDQLLGDGAGGGLPGGRLVGEA